MSSSLVPLAESAADSAVQPELGALLQLAAAGFRVAPIRVVPAAAEESFYRLNNLPAQLSALFAGLELTDPDEDDLEERAPAATRLVRGHFLLDEFVDLFYTGLAGLPPSLRVRRPHAPGAAATGRVVTRGRPALLALKKTWADDWSFGALLERTALQGSVALAAQPVLLAPPAEDVVGGPESARAAALLGVRVRLVEDPALGLTGVQFL